MNSKQQVPHLKYISILNNLEFISENTNNLIR